MSSRIFGIETEFGCLVNDPALGAPETVVEAVKNHAFYAKKIGLIDLHARDYTFEPARSGGFLLNGGRLYIDAVGSHEEYATPECNALKDLVAHDRAGRVILQSLVDDLGLSESVSFHNNSVDHYGGHTFGCHENYLVKADSFFFKESLPALLPFLVTRQIFAGTGRVGGHRLTRDFRSNVMTMSDYEADYIYVSHFYGVEVDDSVNFQLSQRADHIVAAISSRVRFNRAIINPKWDSYYDFADRHRLHVLYGESNMSEYATMLKVGTTSLVLDLAEMAALPPDVEIDRPLHALRTISRDPSVFESGGKPKWLVQRISGKTLSAVDLQRVYLATAQHELRGRDDETDWILREWEATLDALDRDPLSLADRLDWAAKYQLLNEFREQEGLDWNDEMMHSLDLEYHNINPRRGLFYGLEAAGAVVRVNSEDEVAHATQSAPPNTRARGRARIIRDLLASDSRRYVVDWDLVALGEQRQMRFKNPFHTYEHEAEVFLRRG